MDNLLKIVGEIYEASLNPDHWHKVASELCRLLDAHSGAILMEDHEIKHRDIIGSHGLPKTAAIAYRLGLSKYDVTFQLQAAVAPGRAQQLVRATTFRLSHPFYYRLILKPNNIGFLGSMSIYNDSEWHVGIALHRGFDARPFCAEELAKIELLYPHFKRALRIQKEFYTLRSQQHALHKALGRVSLGVVVIDTQGRIEYQNAVATQLLNSKVGLTLTDECLLQAHIPSENKKLYQLIGELTNSRLHKHARVTKAIALHHPKHLHPIHVLLSLIYDDTHKRLLPKVVLYIATPSTQPMMGFDVLQALFGLTHAEATVAMALVSGLSLADISRDHGVSVETVRSQLKSIFNKMGVKKQQDVIRILTAGVCQIH